MENERHKNIRSGLEQLTIEGPLIKTDIWVIPLCENPTEKDRLRQKLSAIYKMEKALKDQIKLLDKDNIYPAMKELLDNVFL